MAEDIQRDDLYDGMGVAGMDVHPISKSYESGARRLLSNPARGSGKHPTSRSIVIPGRLQGNMASKGPSSHAHVPSSLPNFGTSPGNLPFGTSPIAQRLMMEGYVKRVPRDSLLGTSVESSKLLTLGIDDTRSYCSDDRDSPVSAISRDSSIHGSHTGSRHGSRVLSSGFPFSDAVNRQGVIDTRDRSNPGSIDGGSSRSVRVGKDGKLALEVDFPSNGVGNRMGCFHPTKPVYKAIVLFLQCMLTFGSFYCYDIPGALKSSFFHRFPDLTQLEYNLMYSLYSWPNTVQVFFGGYIIDRYVGVRWGCLICSMLGLIGQIMVTIGVQTMNLDLILCGRFVFGMGGETLCVAQSAYVAKWFKGSELATAFGICLSFSRLGSAVNFDVSPAVVSMAGPYGGFVAAEWWGVGACIISLTCVLVLNMMDVRADNVKAREKKTFPVERGLSNASEQDLQEEEVSLSAIWSFGIDVWLIFFICVSFYASVFVFLQNGVQFIRQRYDVTEQQAAFLMSLPYTISAVMCPIFGYLVDTMGRALVWVFLSTTLLGITHFSFAFIFEFPAWVGCSCMGISYSVCAAALWPCIAIVVEIHKLGTAYGLMTAFQNLGLAVFPLVISNMLPEDNAVATPDKFMHIYAPAMSVFAACGASGATLTLILYFVDRGSGGWLNASAQALIEREAAEEMEQEEASLIRQVSRREEPDEDALEPLLPMHVSHQRGRYLSRLGIRPAMSIHGGPRPFVYKPPILTNGWEYERGLAHFQKWRDPLNMV